MRSNRASRTSSAVATDSPSAQMGSIADRSTLERCAPGGGDPTSGNMTAMPERLTGRRVVVVGAGTQASDDPDAPIGNGRAIAVLAAREGATVACVDRDRPAAEETARLVAAEGASAPVVVGDVVDELACARMIDESFDALGGIDGLVCNVGIGQGRGLADTSVDQWDLVTAVNMRSHFLLCRAALPRMTEGA